MIRRALLILIALPGSVGAQLHLPAADARPGTEGARYLSAQRLDSSDARPWELIARNETLRSVRADLTLNSGNPYTRDDGPVWAGRGLTSRVTAVASWASGPLSVRAAPVIWFAQNADISLIPTAVAVPANSFVDAMRPRTIDLPQRFGDDPLGRIEPGESEAVLAWGGARVALTSGGRQIGIGPYHSILMSPDAPGFPRIELGTSAPIASPVGDFALTLSAGRIAQTEWAPEERTGARSGSFIEGRWRPFSTDRLELGGARFYHRDWQGLRLSDITAPFSSLFFDWESNSSGEIDNQLLALFGALRIPEAGLELWAEFGRNDGASSLRDLGVELEHNSAWLFGIQKVWRDQSQNLWALNATGASARIPQIVDFRPQATFYEHNPVAQGHTVRGQLLGTSLLERAGGGEVRLDRYGPEGRIGVILSTRALPQVQTLEVPEQRLRQEWSALFEILRAHPRGFHWFARAGLIADLNRHPTLGDAYNLTLSTGITLRP